MIKIMIADDQELIRESLKIILSTKEEFRVIATVGSGKEVIEAIRREQPDVILICGCRIWMGYTVPSL